MHKKKPLKIPIGVDDFRELVSLNSGFLFVDKTLMIKEFIDSGEKVSLIIRPRRWGKTLNMSMLRYFFASEVNGHPTQGLFDHLAIATESHGDYLKYQGTNPVIFLSFKNIKQNSWNLFLENVTVLISSLYGEHAECLLNSPKLLPHQKNTYEAILNSRANQAQLENAVQFLSTCLYKHTQQKVIILIDEYDTPLNASYNQDYFEQTVSFFKNLLGSALKGNESLEKGIITGILRLSKNKMLSDINNLKLYSLMDTQYSAHFGFGEEELRFLFSEAGVALDLPAIQKWYNGYQSGDRADIYNPWSILNCISNKGDLKPYWIKTGDEDLLKNIFKRVHKNIETKVVRLLEGNSIESSIDEYVSFDQINHSGEEVLWSLLWATGYLTLVEKPIVSEMGTLIAMLGIPNHEVACSYRAVFPKWVRSLNQVKYDSFLKNLIEGNVSSFENALKEYMLSIPSWFDFPRESNYHTFLLGLTASLNETHHIHSNQEAGLGRLDLLLIPKYPEHNPLALILEFKKEDSGKALKDYQQLAAEGLEQINTKKYYVNLQSIPHLKKILKLCIVFYGKEFICQSYAEDL